MVEFRFQNLLVLKTSQLSGILKDILDKISFGYLCQIITPSTFKQYIWLCILVLCLKVGYFDFVKNILKFLYTVFTSYINLLEVMITNLKSQQIFIFVCSEFGGGWVGEKKSEHCSDFKICWRKWMLP